MSKRPSYNGCVDTSLSRWKRAVVHLECVTQSEQSVERDQQIEALRQKLLRKEISWQQYTEEADSIRPHGPYLDARFTGTALFVRHANRRHLVTARHVLWDEESANRELQQKTDQAEALGRQWPAHFPPDLVRENIARARQDSLNWPFRRIFRVSGLDELLTYPAPADPIIESCIRLWPVTGSDSYSFSEPSLDLAVVSLEGNAFEPPWVADGLEARGYAAIASEEFLDEPSAEGADVVTVGFPGATAVIGRKQANQDIRDWSSDLVSLPTFAFGRVAMLHSHLDFFWCDMSVYPGASGSPVIEQDRLVGIVSKQASLPAEEASQPDRLLPFAKAIKGRHVVSLLDQHIEKELYAQKMTRIDSRHDTD
jgi:Trypsin-like peptidase domain